MPGDVAFHYKDQSIPLTANNRAVLEALIEEFQTLLIEEIRLETPAWHTRIRLIIQGQVTIVSFDEAEDDSDSIPQPLTNQAQAGATWRLRRHKWRVF